MRYFARALVALTVLGFATSLAYALLVSPGEILAGDAGQYQLLARAIDDGFGYSTLASVLHLHPEPTAQHPPLFPYFLAGLDKLGLDSLDAHRVVLSLFGAATVALIGLLGRRLAGPRVGLIAAGLAAVYPNFAVLAGMAMVESIYLPLVAATLLLAYAVIARPTAWRAVALGVAAGVTTLARPEGVLLTLLLAGALWLRVPRARGRSVALTLVTAALVLTPWLVRNAVEFDKFPLLSTNGGLTAMVANCESAYYRHVGFFDPACSTVCWAERASEIRYSECGTRAARRYAEGNKRKVPIVVAARIARTWNFYGLGNDISYAQFGGRNRAVGIAGLVLYLLLLPLACAGVLLLVRRGVTTLPLLTPVVVVTVATALSFGFSRYRVAAEVPIVILSAVTLDWLVEQLRRARTRRDSVGAHA
jgi:4-amino-4-deoxy-L-arabinose transferase-like glycosyltransferase